MHMFTAMHLDLGFLALVAIFQHAVRVCERLQLRLQLQDMVLGHAQGNFPVAQRLLQLLASDVRECIQICTHVYACM
jgi:hypothetical protein